MSHITPAKIQTKHSSRTNDSPENNQEHLDSHTLCTKITIEDLCNYLYRQNEAKVLSHEEIQLEKGKLISEIESSCDVCETKGQTMCRIHGVKHSKTKLAPDTKDTKKKHYKLSTAIQSLPNEVQLCCSSIPGSKYGVMTKCLIPKGTWLGPYEGTKVKPEDVTLGIDSTYMWEIFNGGQLAFYLDGRDEELSSWMRFIGCARNKAEQNLYAFQYCGNIYYRAFKEIPAGTELLVWYDEIYPQFMGIPLEIHETEGIYQRAGSHSNKDKKVVVVVRSCEQEGSVFDRNLSTVSRLVDKVNDPGPSFKTAVNTPGLSSENTALPRMSLGQQTPSNTASSTVFFGNQLTSSGLVNPGNNPTRSFSNAAVSTPGLSSDNTAFSRMLLAKQTPSCSVDLPQDTRLRLPRQQAAYGVCPTTLVTRSSSRATSALLQRRRRKRASVGRTEIPWQHVGNAPVSTGSEMSLKRSKSGGDSNTSPEWPNLTSAFPPPGSHTEVDPRLFEQESKNLTPVTQDTDPYNLHIQIDPTPEPNLSLQNESFSNNREHFCNSSTAAEMETTIKGIYSNENAFRCGQCGKTFPQRSVLQIHVCPKEPYKPYHCGHCSQLFSDPNELRNHAIIHINEKPFKCGYCSRSFSGATTLNNHIRTHTGEKPFECSDCGKTFSQASQLSRHEKIPGDCVKK